MSSSNGGSGGLKKMQLTGYSNSQMTTKIGPPNPIEVYLNPEKYTRTYKICYNSKSAQGSSGDSPDFSKSPSDQLDFELVFDATGVVPSPKGGAPSENGIVDQVNEFLHIVEQYDGKTHSPNFVLLSWGKLSFKCRLETFKITYTLFKPNGVPLRARAATSFIGYSDPVTLAKQENTNSPDLSHVMTVNAGDTLPQMCYEIYGSSTYYAKVAKVNKLTDFRRLVVGSQLVFPPLAGATE